MYDNEAIGTAYGNGGGLFIGGPGESPSNLNLQNSTVSGNRAIASGGGIYGAQGRVRLNNATIANNTADSDNDAAGDGGGLGAGSAQFHIANSLIATNQSKGGASPTASLGFVFVNNLDFNLIGDDTNCGWSAGANDIVNPAGLKLGLLADNGGPSLTHKLLTSGGNSPAIDAGNDGAGCTDYQSNVLTTDQRGCNSPQGGRCDIGAFERQPSDTGLFLPGVAGGLAAPNTLASAQIGAPTYNTAAPRPRRTHNAGSRVCPTSNLQHPTSNFQHSNFQSPTSNIQHPISNHPTSNLSSPVSSLQSPISPVSFDYRGSTSARSTRRTSSPLPLDSIVLTPTSGIVFDTVGPKTINGVAHADGYLKTLTVYANEDVIYTNSYPDGTVIDTTFDTTWTPGADGYIYALCRR